MTALDFASVRDELGVSVREEPGLERDLRRVEALFTSLTGMKLGLQEEITEKFQLEYPERLIYLQATPVVEVHQVIAWDHRTEEPDFDADDNLSSPAHWSLTDAECGEIRTETRYDRWKIQYTGGSSTVSDDIVSAIVLQVKWERSREQGHNAAVSSSNVNKSSTTYRDGLYHPRFQAAVRRHKV